MESSQKIAGVSVFLFHAGVEKGVPNSSPNVLKPSRFSGLCLIDSLQVELI